LTTVRVANSKRDEHVADSVPGLRPDVEAFSYSATIRFSLAGQECTVSAQGQKATVKVGDTDPAEFEATWRGPSSFGMFSLITEVASHLGHPRSAVEASDMKALRALFAMAYLVGQVRFDESLVWYEKHMLSAELMLTRKQGQVSALGMRVPEALAHAAERALAISDDPLKLSEDDLPFLKFARTLLGFASSYVTMSLGEKTVSEGAEALNYKGLQFRFVKATGDLLSHEYLSYGQKRLLAFSYYMASPSYLPIAVDELVNGLHHEWIDACVNELSARQSFLTSQNPLLLDCLSFDSLDHVRSCFLLCSAERAEDEKLRWRQMTREEAAIFFEAYEAGIQHVGDILRQKGFW
jgi:hypothetical protein